MHEVGNSRLYRYQGGESVAQLLDKGICGLPVHDEIIVPEENIVDAEKIMIDAYKNQSFTNGFKPTVTISEKPSTMAQITLEMNLYLIRILAGTNTGNTLKTANVYPFTIHDNIADTGKYWKLDLAA